jgi:beta-glucosidase
MGLEFLAKGASVALGPALNIARMPNDGRNFEYISGEDPFLGAELTGPLTKGMQSAGIMANMKHWINNNQETNRGSNSANVDERTEFEVYYAPFQASINAGVGSAMCSYNKINHVYSCMNNETLNYHLRELMGFDGFVMSDWGAVYGKADDYISAGCEQEQGSPNWYKIDALKEVDIKKIDKAVYRVAKQFIKFGLYDEEKPDNYKKNVTSKDSIGYA